MLRMKLKRHFEWIRAEKYFGESHHVPLILVVDKMVRSGEDQDKY